MIEATLFNAWGKPIDTQRLGNPRQVILNPFPTWEFVLFRSAATGRVVEMFKR